MALAMCWVSEQRAGDAIEKHQERNRPRPELNLLPCSQIGIPINNRPLHDWHRLPPGPRSPRSAFADSGNDACSALARTNREGEGARKTGSSGHGKLQLSGSPVDHQGRNGSDLDAPRDVQQRGSRVERSPSGQVHMGMNTQAIDGSTHAPANSLGSAHLVGRAGGNSLPSVETSDACIPGRPANPTPSICGICAVVMVSLDLLLSLSTFNTRLTAPPPPLQEGRQVPTCSQQCEDWRLPLHATFSIFGAAAMCLYQAIRALMVECSLSGLVAAVVLIFCIIPTTAIDLWLQLDGSAIGLMDFPVEGMRVFWCVSRIILIIVAAWQLSRDQSSCCPSSHTVTSIQLSSPNPHQEDRSKQNASASKVEDALSRGRLNGGDSAPVSSQQMEASPSAYSRPAVTLLPARGGSKVEGRTDGTMGRGRDGNDSMSEASSRCGSDWSVIGKDEASRKALAMRNHSDLSNTRQSLHQSHEADSSRHVADTFKRDAGPSIYYNSPPPPLRALPKEAPSPTFSFSSAHSRISSASSRQETCNKRSPKLCNPSQRV